MGDLKFTRRVILGGVAVTVTALSLSGCIAPDTKIIKIETAGQFFTAKELTLLTDVAEIMIPPTQTAGAGDAQTASVVDAMMISWATAETQRDFRGALNAINAQALSRENKAYIQLMPDARLSLLTAMDAAAFSGNPPDFAAKYKRLKSLIFHIFYSSEAAGANYVPIPGAYHGNLTLAQYDALIRERSYGG